MEGGGRARVISHLPTGGLEEEHASRVILTLGDAYSTFCEELAPENRSPDPPRTSSLVKSRTNSKRGCLVGLCALASSILVLGGCRLTLDIPMVLSADVFSDVGGWDLSACSGDGLYTCASLFADNEQLLLGGRTAQELVYDAALGMLSTLERIDIRLGRPDG